MMKNSDFITSKNPETINIIKLKVRDLGFTKSATTDELYKKAEELGLELCPAEIGPHLRLKYKEVFKKEQPMKEYLIIAMKQIADADGNPHVFAVDRRGDGLWLDDRWARLADEWGPDSEFVFRLRKLES